MNQALDMVESYWEHVIEGRTGGETLLAIATQNISERNAMLDYIEKAVNDGVSIAEAIYNARWGIHTRKVSGFR